MLDYSQLFVSLFIVIAFIVGLAWLLQRMGPQKLSLSGPIKIISSTALGARERIALVKAGDCYLLLGITPHAIQTLKTLTESEANVLMNAPAAPKTMFSALPRFGVKP